MVAVAGKVNRGDAVGFTQCMVREECNRKVVRILSRTPAVGGGVVVSVEFLAGDVLGTVERVVPEQVEQLLRLDTLAQARDVVSKLASLRGLEGGDEALIERLLVESGVILSEGAQRELAVEAVRRSVEEAEMERIGRFFA